MSLQAAKHDLIVAAAVAEFQELGFAGASMDRVAARAGVSKRTVYNHFESKEALFRAILDLLAAQCNEAFTITYAPGQPIRDQLRALGWAEGRLITSAEFMKLVRMVLAETIRSPALAEEMNRKLERIAVFQEFVAAAHADGAIHAPDAARAADQFLALIKSQAFWPSVFSGETIGANAMGEIVESTVDVFLKVYGLPGDTP